MTRSRAKLPFLVALAGAVLALSVGCGGDDDDAAADSTERTPASASAAALATPSPTTSSAAGADTLAEFLTDTSIEWVGCDRLDVGDGSFTAACGFATHPFFENWLVQIRYEVDADGAKTGVNGSVRGYGGTCEWDPPDGESYEAPLVEGIARYEGVMLGTGLCDGLQWLYTQEWDDAEHTLVTSGLISRRE